MESSIKKRPAISDRYPIYPLRQALFLFTFLFIFVFPKGGIKINDIPLTWGYSLIGLLTIISLVRRDFHVNRVRLICWIGFVPLQIIFTYSWLVYSTEDIGFTAAFITTFFLLPVSFFLAFGDIIDSIPLATIGNLIRRSMLFVASYGIFLFIYKMAMGHFFEIPLLTVNWQDIGTLEASKYIDRDGIFKLISTYNNGNLYGVCMLMLLPLFNHFEEKQWKQLIVKLALLLTLSRTVWYGLVFCEVAYTLFVRDIDKKTLLKTVRIIAVYLLAIYWLSLWINRADEFLFDPSIGGRISPFELSSGYTILPSQPFAYISEIAYLGVLDQLGVVGLLAFLLALTLPLIVFFNRKQKAMFHTASALGMICYFFVATSDGALLLIPTMAIFLFVASLSLREVL